MYIKNSTLIRIQSDLSLEHSVEFASKEDYNAAPIKPDKQYDYSSYASVKA